MKIHIEEPNEPQKRFLTAENRFIAYGGARGGGKSWAVRAKAVMMALHYKRISILIVRHTYPELRENHILPICKMVGTAGIYRDSNKSITFGNGSRIIFGYLDTENDTLRYQGLQFDVIFLDEATQMTEYQFRTLTACIRGTNGLPKRMYLTCNPGGVGHGWVKRLFIDKDYLPSERPSDYLFIPARVRDNAALINNDPDYIAMLEALPDDLRRAWLDGDWDALAGQYFSEFRREVHVMKPFAPPAHWRRYFAMDYGLDMLAGLWAAFDEKGRCYIYREIYESGLIVSQAAQRILDYSQGEEIYAFLAPSDLWGHSAETGRSQAEAFADAGLWLSQVVAKSRVDGWMNVKEWLKIEDKRSRLHIASNCSNLIRCLPLLQHDAHRPNDCATEPHEITHAPDALRYLLSGRPTPTPRAKRKETPLPFALQTEQESEEYIEW